MLEDTSIHKIKLLNTKNKHVEIEMKILQIIITPKKIKYLDINLKHEQQLYTEKYKMLMNKSKEGLNNGETYCSHGLKDST